MTPRVEDNIRSEGIIKIDAEGLLFLHTFYLIRPKAVFETRFVKFYIRPGIILVRRLPFLFFFGFYATFSRILILSYITLT